MLKGRVAMALALVTPGALLLATVVDLLAPAEEAIVWSAQWTSVSHATLVYGSGRAAVCNAAVLGSALKRLDPSRARVALVFQLPDEGRRHLSLDGLWALHEVPRNRSAYSRKNELWRLPFRRVWFWNADVLPLVDGEVLRATWDDDSQASISAPPEAHGYQA